MPRLILNPGQADEQAFPLRSGSTTIGRTPENDVCVVHKSLSRRHARIAIEAEGRIAIEDLQSKNGTFVGEERLAAPTPLRDGDHVRLGRQLLVFRRTGSAAPTWTESPPPRTSE